MQLGELADFLFRLVEIADVYWRNAGVAGELDVGKRVADHEGVCEVDGGEVVLRLQGHPDGGFAAGAVVGGEVRADVDAVEAAVVGAEVRLHPVVYAADVFVGAELLADALLVGDQDEVREVRAQQLQRLDDASLEDELRVEVKHVASDDLFVDDAVAVQEKSVVVVQEGEFWVMSY